MTIYLHIKTLHSSRAYPLGQEVIRLGRGSQNEIVIPQEEEEALLEEHLKIVPTNTSGYLLLTSSSQARVLLGGEPISQTKLKVGDHLVIGQTHLTVLDRPPEEEKPEKPAVAVVAKTKESPPSEKTPGEIPPLYLVIKTKKNTYTCPLKREIISLGWGPKNEITIPREEEETLQEKHLKFVPTGTSDYLLMTSSSQTRVLLNGTLISQAPFQEGDLVLLGKTKIFLEALSSPGAEAPSAPAPEEVSPETQEESMAPAKPPIDPELEPLEPEIPLELAPENSPALIPSQPLTERAVPSKEEPPSPPEKLEEGPSLPAMITSTLSGVLVSLKDKFFPTKKRLTLSEILEEAQKPLSPKALSFIKKNFSPSASSQKISHFVAAKIKRITDPSEKFSDFVKKKTPTLSPSAKVLQFQKKKKEPLKKIAPEGKQEEQEAPPGDPKKEEKKRRSPLRFLPLFLQLLLIRLGSLAFSIGFHSALAAVLMLIYWAHKPVVPKQLTIKLEDKKIEELSPEPLPVRLQPKPKVPKLDTTKVKTPTMEVVEKIPLEAPEVEKPTATIEAPTLQKQPTFQKWNVYGMAGRLGSGYRGRRGYGRWKRHGGSDGSESAVQAALRWLKNHQSSDGSWKPNYTGLCKESPGCTGTGRPGTDVALTGLALLAFLGNGHSHQSGHYKKTVAKGLQWLQRHQIRRQGHPWDGIIILNVPPRTVPRNYRYSASVGAYDMYSHPIATMALCEAYGMTRDGRLKSCAQNALEFCFNSQNPGAGWRYAPGAGCTRGTQLRGSQMKITGNNDTSVTGWYILALYMGRQARLYVPQESITQAMNWVEHVTTDRGWTGYTRAGQGNTTTTAVGILSRLLCGRHRSSAPVQKGIKILVQTLPSLKNNNGFNFYFWYYATYALYQKGGKEWNCKAPIKTMEDLKTHNCDCWNHAMQKHLLFSQRQTGCEKGSWDVQGGHASSGGRVYTTALAALTLEVYYRYSRVKEKGAK